MRSPINFMQTIKTLTGLNNVSGSERTTLEKNDTLNPELSTYESNGISIRFVPSNRKKTRKITLIVEGEFTLLNVTTVANKILPVFSQFDVVNINLKNIDSIDL